MKLVTAFLLSECIKKFENEAIKIFLQRCVEKFLDGKTFDDIYGYIQISHFALLQKSLSYKWFTHRLINYEIDMMVEMMMVDSSILNRLLCMVKKDFDDAFINCIDLFRYKVINTRTIGDTNFLYEIATCCMDKLKSK